jgi:hypothetical protein
MRKTVAKRLRRLAADMTYGMDSVQQDVGRRPRMIEGQMTYTQLQRVYSGYKRAYRTLKNMWHKKVLTSTLLAQYNKRGGS